MNCPYVVFLLQKHNLYGQILECLQMHPTILRNGSDALSWLLAEVLNVLLEEDVWLVQRDAFDRGDGERETAPAIGRSKRVFLSARFDNKHFLALCNGSDIPLAPLPAAKQKHRKRAQISVYFRSNSASTLCRSPVAYRCVWGETSLPGKHACKIVPQSWIHCWIVTCLSKKHFSYGSHSFNSDLLKKYVSWRKMIVLNQRGWVLLMGFILLQKQTQWE